MKSKLRLLLASLLTAAFCGTAFAQLENFYAEGIVGVSSIKVATGKFTNNPFTQLQRSEQQHGHRQGQGQPGVRPSRRLPAEPDLLG